MHQISQLRTHLLTFFRSRLVGEGLWISTGQALQAIGLVLGIRFQTEFIPPRIFGTAILFVGVSALTVGVVCNPFAQGLLRFLPEAAEDTQAGQLLRVIWRLVAKHIAIAELVIFACGTAYALCWRGSILSVLTLMGLVVAESARTLGMAFYNALRHQRSYALWAAAEAWLRPALAVFSIFILGTRPGAILIGYLAASTVNLFFFGRTHFLQMRKVTRFEPALSSNIVETVRKFSRPLLPLGILSWITALGDRYLIASLVGIREAGIYSAVYGLVSRPFLLAQSTLELTIRPIYFAAVARGDNHRARRIYCRWLALNVLAGLLLMGTFIVCSQWIIKYLLGEEYSEGIVLIPYLAGGHVFLIISYNLNTHLYAHQRTKEILLFTAISAGFSLLFAALFALLWGVKGAAAATICYFGLQATTLAWFVWHREKSAGVTR